MKKANSYPWIFAVIFGVIGIPIGVLVFILITPKAGGLFIGSIIVVGFVIIDFIIAGYRIGESINNRIEIRKKYKDKVKQWEAEGYEVEELKKKWGFK